MFVSIRKLCIIHDLRRMICNIWNNFKLNGNASVSIYWNAVIGLNTQFEGYNKIGKGTIFSGKIGYNSYIGENCRIIGEIGKYTSIASYVHNNDGVHPMKSPYVSTNAAFYSCSPVTGLSYVEKQIFDEYRGGVKIGNDVWIQQGVFLAGGITIEDGAIVMAGAVVVSNVPAYSIVGGVPAKILGYRYELDIIGFLLELKWWNKGDEWLRENSNFMCDINALIDAKSKAPCSGQSV